MLELKNRSVYEPCDLVGKRVKVLKMYGSWKIKWSSYENLTHVSAIFTYSQLRKKNLKNVWKEAEKVLWCQTFAIGFIIKTQKHTMLYTLACKVIHVLNSPSCYLKNKWIDMLILCNKH